MFESTITSKGQTTIPREVRQAMGLKPGDKVRYFPDRDGGFRVLRVLTAGEAAGRLAGLYDGPPKTADEMEEGVAEYLAERHGIPYRKTPDAAE